MPLALLVDVDSEYSNILPAGMLRRSIHGVDVSALKDFHADLILIGQEAQNPLFSAQFLMQAYPSAELVFISAPDKQATLSQQLLATPFVPLNVRVLDKNNRKAIFDAISDILNRIQRKQQLAPVMRVSASNRENDKASVGEFVSKYDNQRKLFGLMVESSNDAILTQSSDGIITSWNRAAERQYGFTAQQAIGNFINIIIPPHRYHEIEKLYPRLMQNEQISNYETEHRNRECHKLDVSLTLSPIRDYQGNWVGAFVVAHDLTEQKYTKNYLAEMQARQTAILDAALDSIITMDHLGTVVEFNPAAESLFGYSRQEAVGKSLAELIIPSRFRELHKKGLERLLITGEGPALGKRLELSAVRRDGSEFPVEVSILQLCGLDPPLFTGFLRDLTELKAAEQESLRLLEDIKRSNEELEQFAYIASHDLKEPLRMVASFSELLAQRYRDKLDEKADKYIYYIVDGATRMRRMIDDLLTYSRVGSREKTFTLTECSEVVKSAMAALAVALRESHAEIVFDRLPAVYGNASLLSEVFQNLIHNAVKFRSDRALKVHIQAKRNKDEWIFSVADNGIGFEMEHAKRIFQMFQRLNQRGKYEGTGVGLALVKKIIERHGGRIWVDAQPDQGATFYFTLPAVHEMSEENHDGSH